MVSFGNLTRIASPCVGFHLGILYGNCCHKDVWPNFNFLLEDQIKLVLTLFDMGFKMFLTTVPKRVGGGS